MNKYYWGLRFVTLRAICFTCGMSGKLKQELGSFVLRSLSLLILFGIKRNFRKSRRNHSYIRIYNKSAKTDCSNYRGISLLLAAYKILLSRLTPYAEEITEDRQFGFPLNRSATDRKFCIGQILEKNGNTIRQCISYL